LGLFFGKSIKMNPSKAPISIVIPMAGRGSRFADAGWSVPKPLIEVAGLPMYARAVSSLPIELCSQIIFVCLAEHFADGSLERDISERYSENNCVIHSIPDVTRGQSETVFLTRHLVPESNSLLIYNADTYFKSALGALLTDLPPDASGVISLFEADGSQYSFAKLDANGVIKEVREKDPISSWATTGMYFFSKAEDFFELAEESIYKNERFNNEFYVAPLYNRLIERGGIVIADYAQEIRCMGTPSELKAVLDSGIWSNERTDNSCSRKII